METSSIILSGDKVAAARLEKYARNHVSILKNDMAFQGLNVSRREIRFLDGVEITINTVHKHSDILIYVPPEVVLPEELEGIPVTIYKYSGQVCMDCDMDMAGTTLAKMPPTTLTAKTAQVYTDNYDVAFVTNDDGYQNPGQGLCNKERCYIDWRSLPDNNGTVDVIVYAGPKSRYGSTWVKGPQGTTAVYLYAVKIYTSSKLVVNGSDVTCQPPIPDSVSVIGSCFRYDLEGNKKLVVIFARDSDYNHLTDEQADAGVFDGTVYFESYIYQTAWDYTATELENAFDSANSIIISGTYDEEANSRGWELLDRITFDEPAYGYARSACNNYGYDGGAMPVAFCYFNPRGTKFVSRVGNSNTFRECTIDDTGITHRKFIDGRYWGGLHPVSQFGQRTAADDGFDTGTDIETFGFYCARLDIYSKKITTTYTKAPVEVGIVGAMDYSYPSGTLTALIWQGQRVSEVSVNTLEYHNIEACCGTTGVDCGSEQTIVTTKITKNGAFFADLIGNRTDLFSYTVTDVSTYAGEANSIVSDVQGINLSGAVLADPLEHCGTGIAQSNYNPGDKGGSIRYSDDYTQYQFNDVFIYDVGNAQIPWADIRGGVALINFALWNWTLLSNPTAYQNDGTYYGMMLKQGSTELYSRIFHYTQQITPEITFYTTYDDNAFVANLDYGTSSRYQSKQHSDLDCSLFSTYYAIPASFVWVDGSLVIGQAAGVAPWYTDGNDHLEEIRTTGDNTKRFLTKVVPESLDEALDAYRYDDGTESGEQQYQTDTCLFRRFMLIRSAVEQYDKLTITV